MGCQTSHLQRKAKAFRRPKPLNLFVFAFETCKILTLRVFLRNPRGHALQALRPRDLDLAGFANPGSTGAWADSARRRLLLSPTPAPTPAPTAVTTYTFLGCWVDDQNDRAFANGFTNVGESDQTVANCATLCAGGVGVLERRCSGI